MRDDLNSTPEKFSLSFLVQHIPVDLACSQIGIPVQIFINEALVMPEVQVCFSAVFRHIDFSVLIRAHGPRIHIDVRIKLLRRHFQAACFQQSAQRSGSNSFSEA